MYVNGRFATKPLNGVSRVATEVLRAADRVLGSGLTGGPFEVLLPPDAAPVPGLSAIKQRTVGRLTGNPWEQLTLAAASRGHPLLNLANAAPILRRRQTVFIYDCGPFVVPEAYDATFVRWYRFLLRHLARTIDLAVTSTESSKKEMSRFLGMDAGRIAVAPLGVDHIAKSDPIKPAAALDPRFPESFVLAVGGSNVRKNIGLVYEAVRGLDIPLVVAGSAPSGLRTASTGAEALELGVVTDGELRWLYDHASCLAFPSLYEGFGLPPVEAMACGCPVIVSDRPSLPEVCGDAALYCDPTRAEDLREQIRAVVHDEHLRADLRERGLKRAASLTWDACARRLLDSLKATYG